MYRDLHTPAVAEVLQNAVVGIAGLGGLGSNAAALLARAGVGSLVLADFDTVDFSNLNRQQYSIEDVGRPKAQALPEALKRVNPYIGLQAHVTRLTEENIPGIFNECSVVVEAFDDPVAKQMIIETVLGKMPSAWIVAASGLAGYGHYEELAVRWFDRFVLCGDGVSEVAPGVPLLAPRVALVAATEADVVIQILMKNAGFSA